MPFCSPRNRGRGGVQSALFVRELDSEHTRSKETSHAVTGFHGPTLSKLCGHLWAFRVCNRVCRGSQPGRVPAGSHWVWVLQTRYTTVFTSCRCEYSIRPKLFFFKQEKFMIKPCKILNLKHQYEHMCSFFFMFKKFVFVTLHMSKKQTVKPTRMWGKPK